MKTIARLGFGLWIIASTVAGAVGNPAEDPKPEAASKGVETLVGNWVGTMTVPPGLEMQMVFRVAKPDGKPISATLEVPDQGTMKVPADSVTLDGDRATIGLKAVAGEFQGTLSSDSTAIIGRWKQGPGSFALALKKVEVVAERRRPQVPKPPLPYKAEDVAYPSQAEGVKLAGTLTIPEGQGPFPAVVLVTGSGPQDRDETLLGHKPFLVLADALTRRGIVVLRADDRGTGRSTGKFATATTEDFADDAQGGVAYLKGRSEVDPKAIGLAGHSEGGVIAPIVAARAPGDVAFIVLLAGTGLTGREIARLQGVDMLRAAGADEKTLDFQRKALDAILPAVMGSTDANAIGAKVKAAIDSVLAGYPEPERSAMAAALPIEATVARLNSPWMRHFLAYDPRPTLAKVRCPVLAINGELDMQVACQPNLDGIAAALQSGGNEKATIRPFPKLNHLFQTCQTGAMSEYGRIEETMAPEVLQAVGDWILGQAGPASRPR